MERETCTSSATITARSARSIPPARSRRWPARGRGPPIDTTERETCSNCEQPPARNSAYLSRFCNIRQRLETGVSGLWLRRSRVFFGWEDRGHFDGAHLL